MDKKLFLALALSLGVLFAFQYFFKPAPVATKPKIYTAPAETQMSAETAPERISSSAVSGADEAQEIKEKETTIETDKFKIIFSDIGGSVKKWQLKEYSIGGEEEIFIEAGAFANRPFAIQSDSLKGLETSRFTPVQKTDALEYILREEGFLEIGKTYEFSPSSDYINAEIRIKNLGAQKRAFSYTVTGPAGIRETRAVSGKNPLEMDAAVDGKLVKKQGIKGTWQTGGDISWVALKTRYFAAILKPFRTPDVLAAEGQKDITTFLRTKEYVLAPGETIKDEYLFYAGPIDEKRLASPGYGMESLVNYGWFGIISKGLLAVLNFFHKGIGNWGVSIILLTLLVNVVTFPLTKKSFISMQQMKSVQPHMQKLKELHKDNPQRMNKEMMELYKKYNVNPFGGCLPLLLQIPIFIALYQALIGSVELKGAHFLWIKDLSRPDAAPLPFSLPVIGNHVNILPLLMTIMMFVQQKMSQGATPAMTDEQASQQKMMLVMMPLLFGFMFYSMPAGLVLYWLTNTILMSTEQGILLKTHGQSA